MAGQWHFNEFHYTSLVNKAEMATLVPVTSGKSTVQALPVSDEVCGSGIGIAIPAVPFAGILIDSKMFPAVIPRRSAVIAASESFVPTTYIKSYIDPAEAARRVVSVPNAEPVASATYA